MERFCRNRSPLGSLRTFLLLVLFLGCLFVTYAEKDFEFSDKKTLLETTDDEELQNDEPGSGPDDIDGSGDIDRPDVGIVTGYPEYYRVTINFTDLIYTSNLADRNSREFQQLAQELEDLIELLFLNVEGSQLVTVLKFSPSSLLVTFDLGTQGFYDKDELLAVLNKAIANGQIGHRRVSPLGFSFKELSEAVMCPTEVGRPPSRLPNSGNNFANLLINNAFPCAGNVIAWEYYRIIPRWNGFVGVWREISENEFMLVGKTELPVAEEGFHIVNVEPPIRVRKGDFIGIFYPRSVEEGVVAGADITTAEVPRNELYENYYIPLYADTMEENVPISLNDVAYNVKSATFAIRAHMDYVGIIVDEIPAALPCTADEFTCYDGECVDINYQCDGQIDCYDGSDEQNCGEIKCAPDEFRCHDGIQCIHNAFLCDGAIECQDGSDETDCTSTTDCRPDQFRCIDGTCIEGTRRCDSRVDCPDMTDEYNCASCDGYHCQNGQCIDLRNECDGYPECDDGSDESDCPLCANIDDFQCADGTRCIPRSAQCDRITDCADGSDEDGCPLGIRCEIGEFMCVDQRQCIPLSQKCDLVENCEDGSDEDGCTPTYTCPEGLFRCDNGDCIDIQRDQKCDRIRNCADGSDEFPKYCNCTHPEVEFMCHDGKQCIRSSLRCNRYDDCFDGSDELGCALRCTDSEFMCASQKECVDILAKCDDYPDCLDGSDEVGCPCSDQEYRCVDGTCIDKRRKCDGHYDCPDRTDESDCPLRCTGEQFMCDSQTECVDNQVKCDGYPDCLDGSDEQDCEVRCRNDEYKCEADNVCIPISSHCNRIQDCSDGRDEQGCPCHSDEFECLSGECIEAYQRCDQRNDCPDGSDEAGCPCRNDEFTCADGPCIPARMHCDRRPDCEDGSDEVGCPPDCTAEEHECDGRCIDRRRVCDGRVDCQDGTDEEGCRPICSDNEFQCRTDGRCIDRRRYCDRHQDCGDGSDEEDCPVAPTCGPNFFRCGTGHCLDERRHCDGRRDCPDGSDERDCPLVPCGDHEFTCISDRNCIEQSSVCNGHYDCVDGSDERECPVRCRAEEFQCESGRCVHGAARCNGRVECEDGSDERNCSRPIIVTVTPKIMTVREGREVVFECQATGSPPPTVRWSRVEQGLPLQASEVNGRLTIPVSQVEDSGSYVCSALGVSGNYRDVATLTVVGFGPTEKPPDGPCGRDEAVCQNGQCIPLDYRCDGENDCSDGSDERECTNPSLCEPNEMRCDSGRCVMKIWRCDGDNDCGDGSDERNCPTKEPGAPCRADEYQCLTGDQCVPAAYQCDGEIDCQDRSDEIGCAPPTIIVPPVPNIEVEVGGEFTIICEAVGVPTPLIVWRLNWGNIPTGDRVTVFSEGGKGRLTIRDAIPEDSGAYTCEAINNKGSIFAIPDAIVIVRRQAGVCQPPLYNVAAGHRSECVPCFCFDHTSQCYSSDLYVKRITLANTMQLINRQSMEPVEQVYIDFSPTTREHTITNFFQVLPSGSYYWNLPREFLGYQLPSYGGDLKYNIYYEVAAAQSLTDEPDVIVMGNGLTLYHRTDDILRPGRPNVVTVPLIESAWESVEGPRRGDTPISEYASKADLVMALENVTSIWIRASYDVSQTLSRIGAISMTTAVSSETGGGRAILVEDCSCPTGYTGLSCQDCAPGFYRVETGEYLGICRPCNCHGHSNDCDARTGRCRNCQDYTRGLHCEVCVEGYVGDATRGTPQDCQPCPCPLTRPSNQFSPTCELDRSSQIICTACPVGYEGLQCEHCAPGYVGNPQTPGDFCRRTTVDEFCDSRGSLQRQPDPITGQCQCKENVDGITCDTCAPNTFFLNEINRYGCLPCFCMGLTQSCTSTSWNRVQIGASFTGDSLGFKLADMIQETVISDGFRVNPSVRELIYSNFNGLPRDEYYWSLPSRFLGDKVTSYGGSLRFVLRYRPGRDSSPSAQPSTSLVEITGNDFTLAYRNTENTRANTPMSFDVKFTEANWMRVPDGEAVTREVLLMTLADLDSILIRATFTATTHEASIRDVTLDVAEDRRTGQDRAVSVEQCVCPRGYRGLSCEDCDTGYTRSGTGLYLGLCTPCDCNGHSSECDSETGICRNCQHNTEGDHCERCSIGFYGDATKRTPSDCQQCPCPLTTPPNQFSQTCILDTDGQVTCTSCPPGHTGRRCESCIAGYRGNPSRPGDYCKIPEIRCECDNRGTIPNAQCDPNTKQCSCKPFVYGLRCARCKDGYFNLDQDNPQGCLSCFCMGITNQCQGSSYYRDKIRPQFNSDGSHNFVITSRRLNNVIQDGFSVNANRNEITFNQFEGIQVERESLFFNLPARFRGDKVSSYGGTLQFTLEYESRDGGREYRDVDIEVISRGQNLRMYHLYNQRVEESTPINIEIPIRESSFIMASSGENPSREVFMTVLADIEAILVRATYNKQMHSVTLRGLNMDVAVPTPTNLGEAVEVESCRCPDGYTGLSCQNCAPGYLRVQDTGSAIGRCVQCSCNGHATSCDPDTGKCLSCQHNTEGDRCERCMAGYYGDATAGTSNDCRPCPCPLTVPSNQFARTCYLATDGQVTCDRCESGYTGRDCGTCERDYYGNPREVGGTCRKLTEERRPEVTVTPIQIEEPIGSSVSIQCSAAGQGPFNIVWSRLDARPLPSRARQGPRYTLTIQDLIQTDTGRYVCTASNVYGSSRAYVDITVVGRQQPIRVRIDEPTQLTVDEGGTARFVCHAMGTLRDATYILSWERRDGHLPTRAIDQNGVLVIPNVQREDAGTYICTGSDIHSVDTARAILIVGSAQEVPQVRIEPRYLNIDEGQPVEFHCIASGRPTPHLEFVRGGDGQISPHATFENGYFRIPAASTSDEAEYYCRATNAVGASEVRTILYVKSGPRPPDVTVIVRQTTIFAIVGTTATLECYVEDGTGQVTFVWSRQGTSLPPGSRQVDGTLTIPNVQQSYSGNYICRGTTPTGISGTATTTLTITPDVERESPTATIEPQRQTIPMGTTGTLRCSVTGKPQPTVRWSRARGELSSNHQVTGETLRIIHTTMEDRGVYICIAENAAGTAQGWTVIEVERRMMPKIDIYPEGSQTIAIGQSALFQCRVMDGDPPPTISWTRAGGESFTSTTDVMENGVLMFHAVTGEEMGGYVCSATNDMGTISATATLIIQGPPTITIQPSKIIYAIVGERVSVECIAEGDPPPSVYWRDERRPQRGDTEPDVNLETLSGSAHLFFNSITLVDGRTYICVAQNEAGSTEETVQIIVEDRPTGESVGVSISGPGTLSVVEGQNVDLTCTSRGLINPAIRWRRREGILPPSHTVRNGNLHIPRFQEQYQGEYICSARAAQGDYESSVFIIVTVSPKLTVSPQRIVARAGDRIELNCRGSGSGPFQIEWRKVNGVISSSVVEHNGLLRIPQVTAADAGEYRCTVTNSAGSNEGYAIVEVQVPPSVIVSDREVVGNVGQRVELRCQASGTPQPNIRWEKELGQLPLQHNVQDGILTIYRLESEDTGRYICTATNEVGSSRDFTYLRAHSGGPDIGTDVRVDTQTVDVGDRVEMECIVSGTPRPTVTWSRLEGPLPASAVIGEELLIIPDAREEDAGTYVCKAVNVAGSVSTRVILYIRAKPIISRQSDMQTAALGDHMTLSCDAHGYPEPDINWYRRSGELPRDHNLNGGKLEIPRIRAEDAGTYICSAENQFGYDEQPVELVVGDLVPYFQQNPISYMSYPPLHDAYLDFDIELNLRPETLDGLVLYNGQYDTGVGDFVCFGLQGGYPEFRYDVGSGPAVIRGNESLELNQWHKVKLSRNRKEGSLIVNDQPAYTGISPGRFQGLDLLENMYLGAVPDFDRIPRSAGYNTGFVGSISEVQLKGIELELGEEAIELQGIEPFNTCYQRPCENGATCISANNAYGYECICARGYMGTWCESEGERCYPGACGQGRCFNLQQQSGYQCVCPFGKTGKGCQIDLHIAIPSFNKTSFMSYATIEDGLMQLTVDIEIKLASLDDGIVLYDAGSEDGTGDFIALVIKDQYLEFRFDTGSGPAVVRSRHPLPVGEWIRITAERKGREGSLTVNDEEPVKVRQWNFYNNYYNRYYYRYRRYRRATAPGRTVGLNLRLPLYLGGVDPAKSIASGAGVTQGFVGCVAQLTVNGREVDLVADAVESANVADCGNRQPCDRNPCRNGGYCEALPNSDYRCSCQNEFTGRNCEVEINLCVTRRPCQNGAPCSIRSNGNYKCDCPLGFIGSNCDSRIELGAAIEVGGDGFVEFDKELLPHANGQEHEVVSFTISTTEPNGLIFWQGKDEGSPIRGGDYLAIALRDGYVELSYELGSGPAMIRSTQRVDSGYQYKIIASRLGRTGTLIVSGVNGNKLADDSEQVQGDSQGILQMLNVEGNIYIGGVPNLQQMTDDKFTHNFNGCIRDIVIHEHGPMTVPENAVGGYNVRPCVN